MTLALTGALLAGDGAGAATLDVAKTPAQVRDYWTAERMESAIPLGPLGESSAPAAKRGTIATRVRHVRRPGKRTHGKVFLTLNGLNYVCSATSVDAPSGSLVWTAGHCVYEPDPLGGGSFATNWTFVPAYNKGNKPFGQWPATKLNATNQWEGSGGVGCVPTLTFCGNPSFDLAAANVATVGGKTLKQRVGTRGIVFNGPRDVVYRPFGYPAAGQFNGQQMYKCRSAYGGDDSGDDPKPMRINCDMTGGSSGGGWVTDGKVASVISYGYQGEPNHLYGPYQGAAAQTLYDSLKNG
ncbi:MAG: trypsin-like serine peptidase [Solirubrobacterales bacterium]